jgi:hypothetical protein
VKIAKARELARVSIEDMDICAVQKHKVRLLDAMRESSAQTYGYEQAIRDGFVKRLGTEYGAGGAQYVPTDLWLQANLESAFARALAREQKLLN